MQITALELVANDAKPISLGVRLPSLSERYLAKAMYGLDAQEIISKYYGNGLNTGRKYYDFVMRPREVVIRSVLNPNYVLNERASDLRDDLYRMVSSNRGGEIRLVLKNGSSVVGQLYGRVTKLEVPHFSKIQELQITISCEDPIIRTLTDIELDTVNFGGGPSYVINDALSTAPHGLVMQFEATANTTDFLVTEKQTDYDWKFQLAYPSGFQTGDLLSVSSVYNDKFVKFERGVSETHVADRVQSGSQWPVLFPGLNDFHTHGSWTLVSVSYKSAFWGV